jgi:hypothetical protein
MTTSDYDHKRMYNHQRSKEQRAEKKVTTQSSIELLRAKHNDLKGKQRRRHHAESQELQRKHENELAYDRDHHGGHGRGDHEREKERRALNDRHQREQNDLNTQLDKEMMAAKKKAAEGLD